MKVKFGLRIRFQDETSFRKIMTEKYALEIKELRKIGTWRHVSEMFSENHRDLDIDGGNQVDGMELCHSAAAYLAENEDDWD